MKTYACICVDTHNMRTISTNKLLQSAAEKCQTNIYARAVDAMLSRTIGRNDVDTMFLL